MVRKLIFSLTKKDFRFDYFRAPGKGGQHKNKTDSACRITHIKSGISAISSDQRSQSQNRKTAFERLGKKLEPMLRKKFERRKKFDAKQRIVRHYKVKENSVRDVRLKQQTFNLKEVLLGNDLEKIISGLCKLPS